jgi:hypothetical protein
MSIKKPTDVVAPAKTRPGPRTKAAIAQAQQACAKRPVHPYIKWQEVPGGAQAASPHDDEHGHAEQLRDVFGTASSAFMMRHLTSLEVATRGRGEARGEEAESLNAALALIGAIDPKDELEGALAVQMASCHALTMEMLWKAKQATSTEHLQLTGNLAIKLQRTFTAQIEALARMRGKGQQTVRVEHVTVQPGAQAIVGDVHHHAPGAPGVVSRTEELPHGSTTAAAIAQGSAALPCPDPQGNGVPIPSDAERPMPAPRRTVTRRAPRKSARLQARAMEP